jgi:hypothetical protein
METMLSSALLPQSFGASCLALLKYSYALARKISDESAYVADSGLRSLSLLKYATPRK